MTGVNVEYLILPEAEYFTKLVADLSQQRGEFSVIMTGPMRNWQFVPPNWIMPLDDFLNNPKLTDQSWFKLEDFYPALIAANRWNGKIGGGVGEGPLYSIPVLEESYILAYRKDIFDQYNIKVPTTLEEMAEAARLVKKNAGIPGIVARGTPSVACMGTGFISGLKSYTDGQWSEFDGKLNATFHDPRAVKFTDTWIGMVRESGPPNWANMQWYDAMEAFTAGQAGMIVDADFFAASYEDPKKSKVAGKVGYALIPAGPGGKTYSGLWTWALGISKATKNKAAAWLFVEWATAQRTLLNATLGYRNYNPSRASITNDPRVQEIMGAWGGGSYLKTVAKNLETAKVAWVPQPERYADSATSGRARCTRSTSSGCPRPMRSRRRAPRSTRCLRKPESIRSSAMQVKTARRRRRWRQETLLPYLLLAPALVLLVGMVYPFGLGLYYSFTSYWLQYPNRFRFIWFDNYVNLVTNRCSSGRSSSPSASRWWRSWSRWGSDSRWRCSCTRVSRGAA